MLLLIALIIASRSKLSGLGISSRLKRFYSQRPDCELLHLLQGTDYLK